MDFSFVVLLISFLFSFLLVLRPMRNRTVGLVVGLFTMLFGGLSITVADMPFFPYFSAFVAVVGVLCMLRAGNAV